jgi:steroid delta-isomerase-like uncharacterized protein
MEYDQAKEFCERWLSAWTGNRPDYLISFYADDAFYSDPYLPQGLKGKEELLAYLIKLIAVYPEWKYDPVEIFPTEKGFILKWRVFLPVQNDTVVDYGMDIVEISEGKIKRNEVYFDRGRLLKAIKEKQSGVDKKY